MLSWTRAETLLDSKALRAPCRSLEKKIGAGPLACGLSKRAAPTSQVCSSTTATLSSIMMADPSTVDTGAGRVCNWENLTLQTLNLPRTWYMVLPKNTNFFPSLFPSVFPMFPHFSLSSHLRVYWVGGLACRHSDPLPSRRRERVRVNTRIFSPAWKISPIS